MYRRAGWMAAVGCLVGGLLPVLIVVTPTKAEASACVDVEPTVVQALATARRCARPVEVLAQRTETDRVLANATGSFTLERAVVAQRVHRADGSWATVDATLRREPSGTVAPVASASDVRFSGGGQAALVTMLTPRGVVTMRWPGALPKPSLRGDTATYAEVLPGVDLLLRATSTGFSHVLVVKSRAAATNPALATLRLGLTGAGLMMRTRQDGGAELYDRSGHVALSGTSAQMWDSASVRTPGERSAGAKALAIEGQVPSRTGAPAHSSALEPGAVAARANVLLGVSTADLILTPDRHLLTAPDTVYPVFIDPSWSTPAGYWAYSNHDAWPNTLPNQAWVGYNPGDAIYRSAWSFPTGGLAGKHITRANLTVTLAHSWSCGPTPVTLFRTLNPDQQHMPGELPVYDWLDAEWGNAHKPSTGAGCAGDPQPDQGFTFGEDGGLMSMIIAHAGEGTMTFGLAAGVEASGEGAQSYWKKFWIDSARLVVDYNSVPSPLSGITVEGKAQCGRGASAQFTTNIKPTITAYLHDDDEGATVYGKLEIWQGGTYLYTLDAAQAGNNYTAQWGASQWNTHALQVGQLYSYRLYAFDGLDNSAVSPFCDIKIDPDAKPGLAQAEVVGTLTLGQPATIRFFPAAGETAVIASYDYGYDQDRLSMTIDAAPDGTAVVPLTIFDAEVSPVLFVRARTRAGKPGDPPLTPTLDFFLDPPNATPAHKRHDANADGRADVIGLRDLGTNSGLFYSLTTKPGNGTFAPVTIATDFTSATTRVARGDFDGDGFGDLALFRTVNGSTTLTVVFSIGQQPESITMSVSLGTSTIADTHLLAGDFAGHGTNGGTVRDDLVLMRDRGNYNWDAMALLSSGVRGAGIFAAPVRWFATSAPWGEFGRMRPYAGDFDGDKKADISIVYDYPDCQTGVFGNYSTGTKADPADHLTSMKLGYLSGVNGWCAGRTRPVTVGDATGDGRDDLAGLYDYGNCMVRAIVFVAGAGNVFTPTMFAGDQNGWCDVSQLEAIGGDIDNDGKADLSIVTKCCGTGQIQVWWLRSQTTSYAAPALRWEGAVGPPATGDVGFDPTKAYQIMNVNSGKCIDIANGLPTVGQPLAQYTCNGRPWQTFKVAHQGSSWNIKPMHATGLCLDVDNASPNEGATLWQYTCNGGVAQVWGLDYMSGWGTATQVQIRSTTTGKCFDVVDLDPNDGAAIRQYSCWGGPNQQWILTPVSTTGPGVRYTMSDPAGSTMVGDVSAYHLHAFIQGGSVGGGLLTLNGAGYAQSGHMLANTLQSFTASAWVRTTPNGSYQAVIGQDGAVQAGFNIQLHEPTGKWAMVMATSDTYDSGAYLALSTSSAQAGVWTHLTGVYDAPTRKLKIYVNGQLQATADAPPTAWPASGVFTMGRTKWNGGNFGLLNGVMDDVRLYDRALSASEITSLAAQPHN